MPRKKKGSARQGNSQGNRQNELPKMESQPCPTPTTSKQDFPVERKEACERRACEIPASDLNIHNPRTTNQEDTFQAGLADISDTVKNVQLSSQGASIVGRNSARKDRMKIISRPNFGTEGRPIALVSNFFLIKGTGKDVYHYDIEITSRSSSGKKGNVATIREERERLVPNLEIQQKLNVGKQRCREVIFQLIRDKNIARFCPFYDGRKNLYTFHKLPISGKQSVDVCLTVENGMKNYIVTIQPVTKTGAGNIISLDILNLAGRHENSCEALMAFETLLCHRDSRFRQVAVGRSFFSFNETRKTPLDGEVEIWKGYNQSVNLTLKGPAVVINVATKAFHSGGFVIEHACAVLGLNITTETLRPEHIQKLSKSLHNIKVEVTHLPYPRKYTVDSVSRVPANELIVDIGDRRMSVAEFFAQKYKRLTFPYLPCLVMKSNGRQSYTPMECCFIVPGQPKLGKLNSWQTSKMIGMTAITPDLRFKEIENYAKQVKDISGRFVNASGFEMETKPLSLNGRVRSPPALSYQNEPRVRPDNRGVWRIDGKSFSAASRNAQWALISFGRQDVCPNEMLNRLSSVIVTASTAVGLCLNKPVLVKSYDRRTTTYAALLEAKRHKVDFVFAVLSRVDDCHSYDELKFFADVKLGLITQCMEDKVVSKCCHGNSTQIINNVFSKINIKLGGINHTFSHELTISMKRTMVMGADAAHSPRGSRCPSIAAVVGNVDDVPFQYAVTCRIQKNTDESKKVQEIILDMKEMTKHILSSYRKRNLVYPERIIMFRDGVSEGQFRTVLEEELRDIQYACDELVKRVLPVTFIIVQKRHQTRFRPQHPRDGIAPSGNVPPGTTVDTDVVHPSYFDYYLCSHEGIKGTSKPAHYVVLHDDNKYRADELQQFSYDLCHVYARCNRSISIPAPAMNAHLAAARAKKYIDWHISMDPSNGSSSGSSGDDPALPQEVLDYVNKISTIEAPMFFV